MRPCSDAQSGTFGVDGNAFPGEQRSILIEGVECKFSFIPKGTFLMGSPDYEKDRRRDETQRQVELTQDFWLMSYLVTQELYETVVGENPSGFKGARRPVENVSWIDSASFAEKLNLQGVAPDGWRFDLPTEAQWEYACRAGTTTPFWFGSQLNGDKANCDGTRPYGMSKGLYLRETTDVGSYPGNPWNLYDMHGNVFEWCKDLYTRYPDKSEFDPCVESGAYSSRVLRGGRWCMGAKGCRSAYRFYSVPYERTDTYGFRLALVRQTTANENCLLTSAR